MVGLAIGYSCQVKVVHGVRALLSTSSSECDRPSLNPLYFSQKILPLVCILFRAHEMRNFLVMVRATSRHHKGTGELDVCQLLNHHVSLVPRPETTR